MGPFEGMLVTPSVRLARPLGAGGMGAVWVADHLTLHTHVVVKFISGDLAANEDIRARFSREASAAAAVKSPHVVQMLDHGVVDGLPFIVMELLEGEDLRRRIDRDRVLPLQELDAVLTQACKALGQAHRAGIVHRDIKPDNIFLCKNEEGEVFVKLLDFGIAKKEDWAGGMSATRTGAVMGTPYYMSPEQALARKGVDFRTDLWSLGVVMFEAMTGRKAFDGDNIVALGMAISQGPIPIPTHVNPALPPAVDAWFARACARDVGSRFGSAREMAEAFHAAVFGSVGTASAPRWSVSTPGASFVTAPARTLNTTTAPTSQAPGNELGRAGLPSPVGRWIAAAALGGVILVALAGGVVWHLRARAAAASASSAAPSGSDDQASQTATVAAAPPTTPAQTNAPTPSATSSPAATAATVAATVRPNHPASTHATTKPVVEPPPEPPKVVAATTPPPPPKPPKPAANCNPPFYFDASGNKVFKKECFGQ